MAVNARLVALGTTLLLASSGLLFETGGNDLLAASVAALAVAGTALAVVRARASAAEACAV